MEKYQWGENVSLQSFLQSFTVEPQSEACPGAYWLLHVQPLFVAGAGTIEECAEEFAARAQFHAVSGYETAARFFLEKFKEGI